MYVNCPKCSTEFHIICLSKHFFGNTQQHYIIPIDGSCPHCLKNLLWGEIIQNKYVSRPVATTTASAAAVSRDQSESDDDEDIFI